MLPASLLQFAIVQVSFAFSPGLIITLIVRTTLTQGKKMGLKVVSGAALGCLLITLT